MHAVAHRRVSLAAGQRVGTGPLEVGQPIKALGDYTVSVRLHPEVAAKINVKVVAS